MVNLMDEYYKPENRVMKTTSLRMELNLWTKIKHRAWSEGTTMHMFIISTLYEKMRDWEPNANTKVIIRDAENDF